MTISEKLFYKYRNLKDEYDKDGNCKNYTLTNLARNQLYFSTPTKFNDPFDCRARLVYPHDNRINEIDITFPRVCCFSEINDNILMWSHYADGHQGICLCFKAKKYLNGKSEYTMPIYEPNTGQRAAYLGEFKKVCYDHNDDLCVLNALDNQNKNSKVAEDQIYKKLYFWEYEHEYRMILPESHINKNEIFEYDKESLVGVIFGLRIDKKDIIRVYNAVKENYNIRTINFYEARGVSGKCAVCIKSIDNIEKCIARL